VHSIQKNNVKWACKEGSVKSLFTSRRFAIIIFLILAVALAACERQLDPDADATTVPPALTQPALPTTDPALVPTTDPALVPTTDPALVPTTDPAAQPTVAAQPDTQATPQASGGTTTHTVVVGETLFTIAQQYNLTVEEIAAANNLDQNGVLNPGQVLNIPTAGTTAQPTASAGEAQPTTAAGERTHVVAAGENLYRIGLQYGFTYQELAAYNGITNPDRLSVGEVILIPPTGN
jgi:LysM repeat protein